MNDTCALDPTALWQPWSLEDLLSDLASGAVTFEAAFERAQARIGATEPTVHAWVDRHLPPVSMTPGLPLSGVPFGVKDIIDLAGYATRCGSALRASASPVAADAAIVTRWRGTGAVPLGKTVTTEFAFFSPGPTANPADPAHTPGGSSSGSAAAVAAGQVPLALGSQTAGSVTRPASYCGIASLVMTRGRFPSTGVVGLSPSLDAHGMFAATPADLQCAWTALTSSASINPARPPRILTWDAATLAPISDAMNAAVDNACAILAHAGAEVAPFAETSLMAETAAAHPVVMAGEAAHERAAELAEADRLSEPLAKLLRTGAATTTEDVDAARAVITAARRALLEALRGHDLILGPAAPGSAPRGLDATGDPVLSRPWQALGLPQVTIPGLRDSAGMPLGLQVIGGPGRDTELLGWADWIARSL